MKRGTACITKKGVERWKNGHPWIYAADVESVGDDVQAGDVVRVEDTRGWFLGQALYSKASKISLRWLAWDDTPIDEAVLRARLEAADALRRREYPDETAYRVVHGEADQLPGLVVDRFGDYLSVQFLHAGTERKKQLFVDLLVKHFKPKAIVNRSDAHVRNLEGLEPEKGVLFGELPPVVTYREGHVVIEVELLHGQKTGAFLDQRDNHVRAADYGVGEALDCFSYAGGFALQLALKAKRVTAVEISEPACAQIKKNAERNRLPNVETVCANVFDYLRDTLDEGRRFDTIVLDPPSFAKKKDDIAAAARGYKEINLRAMQLLNPGGTLITASCTHHIDETRFEEMLDSAAADSKRRVQIVEKRGAGRDHPVLLGLRETRYLKCFVLRVL
ncbi:MAG: class I SAM-dependent rRNA methyltransferase [Myxococcaceae bacterium]|nr:class I SAM-dependent rRNA methyltransferase [Myxococcaceae bacterium]